MTSTPPADAPENTPTDEADDHGSGHDRQTEPDHEPELGEQTDREPEFDEHADRGPGLEGRVPIRPSVAPPASGAPESAFARPEGQKVLLAGDSTATAMDQHQAPMTGWGTSLPSYLPAGTRVRNAAFGGATTASAIERGAWAWLVAEIAPGDVVIIQYGHNDQKSEDADAREQFIGRLRGMVADVRARGGVPVLATSIARRRFADGELVPTHRDYPQAVRTLAPELGVELLDLEAFTADLLRTWGEEGSLPLLTHAEPGEHPNYPEGVHDDSHITFLGADLIAREAVRQLIDRGLVAARE